MISKRLPLLVALLAGLMVPGAAAGQEAAYPARPVTIIVPFASGGPTDLLARIAGDFIARRLGQPVVVENVTGAAGRIGTLRAAKAVPDGYTLLMGNVGTHAAVSGLYKVPPYDPAGDFEPIALVATGAIVLVARKDLPIRDIKGFVKFAKENSARLNYGSAGVGSTSHIACTMLAQILRIDAQHVAYRGASLAMADVLKGQIDYVCDLPATSSSLIESGQVLGLVVASDQRSSLLPTVPTADEAGLAGFKASAWNGLFAPKGTPVAIIDALNSAFREGLKDPAAIKRLQTAGGDVPGPELRTAAAFKSFITAEIPKWVTVIRSANIVLE